MSNNSNIQGNNNEVGGFQAPSDVRACGDQLSQSESGVELKSLLKLIDNVIEMSPATDDEVPEYRPNIIEKANPFNSAPKFPRNQPPKISSDDGKVTLSEVLMVPVQKYPKYNFVGRILGPRGMTVKQLEKETGCKIFVKGRASSTSFNPHTKTTRHPFNSKNTLSTISQCALTEEPLHVLIECNDFPHIAAKKLTHAVTVIDDLLSPPADGKDELKRQQLVDISLINGTYRATSTSQDILRPLRRYGQTVDPTSNPADFEVQPLNFDHGLGDYGTVYGITQQKRIWQKPRGPDSSSLEYAKSVSSREFVTDIVNKTKNSPVKHQSDDSMFNLSESMVNETLKVAQNLLASHKHLTFGSKSTSLSSNPNETFDGNKSIIGAGDGMMKTTWKKEIPLPSPMSPPPLMSSIRSPPPFSSDFYFPPSPFPDFPFPQNGLFYMLPPPPSPFLRRY